MKGARNVHLSGTNGDNLSLVGILGSGWENDPTGGGGLLGSPLDQDAVGEWLEFAKECLYWNFVVVEVIVVTIFIVPSRSFRFGSVECKAMSQWF